MNDPGAAKNIMRTQNMNLLGLKQKICEGYGELESDCYCEVEGE